MFQTIQISICGLRLDSFQDCSLIEKYTLLKLRFLLRNDEQIIVPMDNNKEIKNFLFKVKTSWIQGMPLDDVDLKEILFEELKDSLYFNEFLIQIFHEKFDVFIASIVFDLEGNEYNFSDIGEEYYYWIDKDEPRITLDEEYGRIEMDIYQFDDYIRDFGMDKENFEFSILGQQLSKADVKIYF